ncbi:MAG: hypothetical protein ACODAE_11315 [Gemmatimonadota bacterium]
MAGRGDGERSDRGLRYEPDLDRDFQRRWLAARDLSWDQVEAAFRHGLLSSDRFAERPFDEVADYLRESWNGMGPAAAWDDVADIVRSGYELGNAGEPEDSPRTELTPEALERFASRTTGGSAKGGTMGERPAMGGAEPASEFEGEGGEPVGGRESMPDDARPADDGG